MARSPNLNAAWQRLRTFGNWRASVLPGLTLTGIVIILRLVVFFELSEWKLLDVLLRSCPTEPVDERVVIVGIDEADIQSAASYPLSDLDLSLLLQALDRLQPRAVGVDIFRDLPVEPGHKQLVNNPTVSPMSLASNF
ncbi:MAG: CHASE2 domain-containing protein [Phormidesmis sp.]